MDGALRLGAVVLAAGASTRMGRPKGALVWHGRTLLEHAIAQAGAAGIAPESRVVVLGPHRLPVPPSERVVEHPRWNEGPLSSLQGGLVALDARSLDGVLVLTVDRPRVRAETLAALRTAFEREPTRVWQPAHRGRRGHPLIWPAAGIAALLDLPPTGSRRWLLEGDDALPRGVIDLDDEGVLDNVDRPEDLARLESSSDS